MTGKGKMTVYDRKPEYEADYHTGMNIQEMAEEIYQYTSGYPVLVSSICKYLDEKIIGNGIFEKMQQIWTQKGVEEELSNTIVRMAKRDKSYFIHDGQLDMDTVMRKFVEYFHDIYGQNNDRFVEDNGRKLFQLYLKPIINGIGNYYIEAQTRDARRTDIIVDYLGEQFIIELKIWHGNEYNQRGVRRLRDYLDYYHKNKGYLLSFNFNKTKETGMREIRIGDKMIVEAVV